MGSVYAPPPSTALPLRERLGRAGFQLDEEDGVLMARRLRRVPDGGFVRLLFPRMVVHVRAQRVAVTTTIQPDGLAWMMLVVFAICAIFLTMMDRSMYTHDKSPYYIYGGGIAYVVLFVAEYVATWRALRRAMAGADQG